MATIYSRAGLPFDDKAAWGARLQAALSTELAKVRSRLTNEGYQVALSLGQYLGAAVAGVLSSSAVNMANAVDSVFPQYAQRNVLELWGTILGVPPLGSDFATGNVKFFGTNGTTIAISTVITSTDGQRFQSTQAGTCNIEDPETGDYYCVIPVVAFVAGANGNMIAGSEFSAVPQITGVNSISNTIAFANGRDVEATETYRARIISRIVNPPVGASANDLATYAETNESVLKAWCKECYPQPGLATVYYLRSGGDPVPIGSGAAYMLPIVAISNPTGTTWTVSVTKATVDDILGWIVDDDYFVGGSLIFGHSSGLEGQEFEIASVATVSTEYVFTVVGEIATTAGARTFGLVDLLDAQTRATRDAILTDDAGNSRKPLGLGLIVREPALSTDQPYIEFTITPATAQVVADSLEAVRVLLRDAPQGATLANWEFHKAIEGTPNHASHVLIGVGTLDLGDTPTGSIAISDTQFFNLFQAKINGVTYANQDIWTV